MAVDLTQTAPKGAFFAASSEQASLVKDLVGQLNLRIDVYDSFEPSMLSLVHEKGYQLAVGIGVVANNLRKLEEVTILEILPDLSSFLQDIHELAAQGAQHIAVIALPNFVHTYNKITLDEVTISFYPVSDHDQIPVTIGEVILNQVDAILSGSAVSKYIMHNYPDLCHRVFSISEQSLLNTLKAAKRILHLEKVKRLQLTRLDLLINSIQEGVLIFNKKQEIVFHNALVDNILKDFEREHWYETLEPYFETTNGTYSVISLQGKQFLMHTMHFIFPGTDIDNHVVVMQDASSIEHSEQKLRRYNQSIQKGLIAKATFQSMIVQDSKMQELVKKAKLFARTDSTVLIYGETGVGKEVLAQSMHNHSARKSEPFVSLNCASLPPSLIESELFGYADGAFTGARRQGKKGLFELANHGTIFLDEIGELSLDVQSRLLRVLQEREVMRIGDERIIPLDVRVICATNRDLLQMAHMGTFRLDLYYRVNVLQLRVPPLRERASDIITLFMAFIKNFLSRPDFQKLVIDEDAKDFLHSYPWPGNIRELHNVAEAVSLYGPHITIPKLYEIMCLEQDKSAILTSGDAIKAFKHLDLSINSPASYTDFAKSTQSTTKPTPAVSSNQLILKLPESFSLKDIEREALQALLKTHSAPELCSKLGISRVTLWRKLKQEQE